MNPTVYVETSVISYLTTRRSRDIVIAAHQQLTRRWWRSRSSYRLFVSQIARDEAGVGDHSIIEELHRVREAIGKAHGFDARRIAAAIRQHEAENPEGIIHESPKRTTRRKTTS